MFNLFLNKKSLIKSDLLCGLTDFHSHILPSVDDGIRCVDDAIKVLSEYENLGIKRVVFTPHIMESFPENSAEFLRSEFDKFRSIYSGSIELSLAAEYMLDSMFDEYLERGDMLTLQDNYLLVETSYISPPMNFETTLSEINSKGYFVVLAHPERYGYMREEELKQLKSDGVLFQLNLLSLSGFYGKRVKDRAMYLLDNDMYNIMGSDIHNLDIFQKWINQVTLKSKQLEKLHIIKESIGIYTE